MTAIGDTFDWEHAANVEHNLKIIARKEVKQLEAENQKLKKRVAELEFKARVLVDGAVLPGFDYVYVRAGDLDRLNEALEAARQGDE